MAKVQLRLNEWNGKFFLSEARNVALFSEFRSGKTVAAGLKVLKLLKEYPGTWCLVVRNLYRDLIQSTIPQFKKLYDWDTTGESFNKSHNTLSLANGSVIIFTALDRVQDTRKLKNLEIGLLWLEQAEEIRPEIWDMARGRLSQKGAPNRALLTGNPEGKGWFFYQFFQNPVERYEGEFIKGEEIRKREYGVFKGEDDNYIGVWPPPFCNEVNLPPHYYEQQIRTHPKDWVDKYMFAMFTGHGGLIHKDYDEKRHLIKTEDYFEMLDHWERYEAMDYGISNPTVWHFMRYDRENDIIYILDEYYVDGQTISYHIPNIRAMRKDYGKSLLTVGCPRAFQTERDGKRPADEYRQNNINLSEFPIGHETRVEIVNRRFKQNKIKIYERCTNLRRQLESINWKNFKDAENHALESFQRGICKIDSISSRPSMSAIKTKLNDMEITVPITGNILEERF